MRETKSLEFKESITNTFLKTVSAYANYGTGKIQLQMWLYILGGIINIPLSIYFIRDLNMGSSGAILGTNICMLPLAIIMPIQAYFIIKKMK